MTVEEPFIVFGQPCLDEREVQAVAEVLRARWIGTGPKCQEFEEAFAQYKQVPHALGVSSCTAALHLSLQHLGLEPGDEVLTSPVTFAATANVIEHLGARPVFVDVEPHTGNLNVSQLEARINNRTRAVVVVHLAGRPVEFGPLLDLGRRHDLRIIEDCAHAIEGAWQGKPLGTLGDTGCFSFYATKNLTTAEGGMLISRDGDLLQRCRISASHGLSSDAWTRFSAAGYRHWLAVEPGYKFNLTDVQAAMGLVQLDKLEAHAARRTELWHYYLEALADLPLQLPPEPAPSDRHAHHLFSPLLRLEEVKLGRDELLNRLHELGIGSGVHFVSLHLHPFYREKYGYEADDFPHALTWSERTFSLPLSGGLSLQQAERVVTALRQALTGC